MLRYQRMPKETFIVRNRITLQAAILDCSEAAVHSHPFSKISPRNTGSRILLLVKLQTDCSEWGLYTKMTTPRMFCWQFCTGTVQKQQSTASIFENLSRKYWWQSPSFGQKNLFFVAKLTYCGCRTFGYMKEIFPWIIFFSVSS